MKITNPDEPNSNLKQALENLETFVRQIEKELVPNLSHFDVLEGKLIALPVSPLRKRIGLAYRNIISPGSEKQSAVLDEILHSSDVIKSYFPLIQVMEEGSTEQKKFAAYAKGAIERFNQALDEAANQSPSWQQKIVCFLYEKSGLLIGNRLVKIDLPQKACLHIDFPPPVSNHLGAKKNYSAIGNESIAGSAEKISHLRELVIPTFQVQQQTLELYYMKVISLLEKNKLFSKVEARSLVLKTPTNISLDKEAQRLTISQQLIPLPGQLVEVSATFLMDKRTLNFSIFQSDNLSTQSTQTGFPHPLQHHGWALPEILIPKFLHRPGLLHYFPALFQGKGQIAQALLPNGPLVERAGMFLRKKRQTFEEHRSEFISYHKNLALAIAEASIEAPDEPQTIDLRPVKERIDNFFDVLIDYIAPYDFLSKTHHQIMHRLVTIPHMELEKAWLRGEVDSLKTAQKILNEKMKSGQIKWHEQIDELNNEDKPTIDYCRVISELLFAPMQQLILQQNSEIMRTPPPILSLFAKKLQIALYLQLWEFQHELSLDPQETDVFCRLSRLLEDDITLFKAHNFLSLPWTAVAVSKELETYYNGRWMGLRHK